MPSSNTYWRQGRVVQFHAMCVQAKKMTPVGFEPTPCRNGAWSHRLRPLGQSVADVGCGRFGNTARLKPKKQCLELLFKSAVARSVRTAHSTNKRALAIGVATSE